MRGRSMSGRRGVTLLELMIALAVIAILGAIMIPTIVKTMPTRRLKGSARDVFGEFQRARLQAATNYYPYRVQFDLDNGTFRLQKREEPPGDDCESNHCTWVDVDVHQDAKPLQKGVSFAEVNGVSSGLVTEVFNPNGTAQAGNVILTNIRGEQYIVTVSNPGKITMRRLSGG